MSNKTPAVNHEKTVSAPKPPRRYLHNIPLVVVAGYIAGSLVAVLALWLFLQSNKVEAPSPSVSVCETNPELSTAPITAGDVTVNAEVAETQTQKYKGLSGRTCLNEGSAMLFPYETAGSYCFVMRDMRFPIDMIWLDENKRVVTIKHEAHPDSYPEDTYCPESPAQYVLEVAAGLAKRHGWATGTQFSF